MRIKKLELIGFKSFKDRTVIQFDAGITGIVGPNGCGKSNIVDALLWAMGEMSAKHLRGSSMEDVIFAGAEGYSPLGMAEVSLTLENDGGPFPAKYSHFSEIMVTRRLHRNGESEYLVNKEPARLKDVQEIFMDTGAGAKGFSIIAQGTIGQMITAKPEDRKNLIEEAAGITKFKARKKESQRKLQATDQNLIRLQDITGELKRQIDSLQRQAQRAERYRNLKTQIEDLDLWLSSIQYKELAEKAHHALDTFNQAQGSEVAGEADLSTFQAQLEHLKVSLSEKETEVQDLQISHQTMQSETQKKELRLQELKFEIEKARQGEQMAGTLLDQYKLRAELLQKSFDENSQKKDSLESEVSSLRAQFELNNSQYQGHQGRIQEADDELTSRRRELFAVGQTLSSIEGRIASMNSQLEDIQTRLEHDQSVLVELKEKVIEFEQRRNRLVNELEKEKQMALDLSSDVTSFEANKKVLTEQLNEKRNEVEIFKDSLNEVTSRLYGLENLAKNFEGFEEGVKTVMLWQKVKAEQEMHADGTVSTHLSPVSEVVEVPSEYEVAMEAALGSRLQMLLASDSQVSVQAVDHLKETKSGRSSFFSGGSIAHRELSTLPKSDGVLAILKDVVQASETHQKAVQYLLDGVVVVDSIRTALQLRSETTGWTFVTADGDTLTADGVLTGGSSESAESGVLKRRREIKELSQKKDEWAGKLSLAQMALKKVEAQLENVINDFEGAQKRRVDQEIKVTSLKKDVERAEQELANAGHAVERQEREVQKTNLSLQTLDERIQELTEAAEDNRSKKIELESRIQNLDLELSQAKNGFEGLQASVTELQVKLAAREQELDSTLRNFYSNEKDLAEVTGQLARVEEESTKNQRTLSDSEILLEQEKLVQEQLIRNVQDAKENLSEASNEYQILLAQVRDLEEKTSGLQKARNDLQSKMNEAQLILEQARMKEMYLIDQIRERYVLELPDVIARFEGREGDPKAAEVELKDLREKISKIGEVNLSAIEEYTDTAKRYEFLTQQQQDLVESKEQLRRVIERINKICSKRFKETFDMVNERFQKVFPVLFGGGEARLELHEDPESQEMGIEIIAKPPGKKMQSVTLMSGGEKALTAVALVFSIFLVKPSPYCLLDEVDAPLDDANVYRFNDLVREMAKRSQIIVVTHNKHTMEVAKKLYGVTMQEKGVSTMVSVNLSDIR